MALVAIKGSSGFEFSSTSDVGEIGSYGSSTLNATGESSFIVGTVKIVGGGSKTISATGGGSIWWYASTVTMVNGGTSFRLGIQDVDASGLNDDVFDVYCQYDAGSPPTTLVVNQAIMTSGTKTLTDGDLIAIGGETVSIGGSDTVVMRHGNTIGSQFTSGGNTSNYPYRVTDTGAGPTKQTTAAGMSFLIEFDDGTLGYIYPYKIHPGVGTTSLPSWHVNSTPDEYAILFQVPFACAISGARTMLSSLGASDDYELILYSDAKGTPTVEFTITVDATYISTGGIADYNFTEFTLAKDVWYGFAVRPTTTNALGIVYQNTADEKYKATYTFGTNLQLGSRTNQTGAFSVSDSGIMPYLSLNITKLDDGTSSGGGETSHVF